MYLYHFGVLNGQNAGDTIIAHATRNVIANDSYWGAYHIYDGKPRDKVIQHINEKVDAVVVGGGGFIIPSLTESAHASGWHSPLSLDQLKQIRKPIIGFGLGYNRFSRQAGFNKLFVPNINQFVRQSIFFGLRNYGSIEKLKPYLEKDLISKLKYQPDPATLLSYLYPQYNDVPLRRNEIALEVALDSTFGRYGGLEKMSKALKELRKTMVRLNQHYDVKVVLHGICDMQKSFLVTLFGNLDVQKYPIIKLFNRPVKDILEFYAGCPLTIAMRGHGQLIPFGLGNPFISLLDHPKLQYFLDDVGLDGAVDIDEPYLSDRLVETVETLDTKKFREKIIVERKRLWEKTQENLTEIKTAIER